jgi:glycosyltransferase involved in cell wall biosynthesis
VHCHDLAMLPAGWWIKRRYGNTHTLVYDCHEHETETQNCKGWKKRCATWLERALISSADAVICVSESIANEYVQRYHIPKPYLVLNCPPLRRAEAKTPLLRERLNIPHHHILVLYQGAMTDGRNLPMMLRAASTLAGKEVSFVFMGYGKYSTDAQEAAALHPHIHYHEAVPSESLLAYTASADIGLLFTEDSCLSHHYSLPNKLFEYQMAGLPVIASDLPEIARVLRLNNTGILLQKPTEDSVVAAISSLSKDAIRDMCRGIDATTRVYNWENQQIVLLKLYAALAAH